MADIEKVEATAEVAQPAQNRINETFALADAFVRKSYLGHLHQGSLVPLSAALRNTKPGSNLRLAHLDCITFDQPDQVNEKLKSVYSAVAELKTSSVLLLDGRTDRVNLYLGIAAQRTDELSMAFRTYWSSFQGTFPGCRFSQVKASECEGLLDEIFQSKDTCVATVTALPLTQEYCHSGQVQGFEKLIDGMLGKPFSMMLLSQAIAPEEITQTRRAYEALYTQLSAFQRRDYSWSESDAEGFSLALSESVTKSMAYSSSVTQGYSDSSGTGASTQSGPDMKEHNQGMALTQLAGAGLSLLIGVPGGSLLQSLFYGQTLGGVVGNTIQALGGDTQAPKESHSTSSHQDHSENYSQQTGENTSTSDTTGKTQTDSKTHTSASSVQMSQINKPICDLLEQIDGQIKRLQQLESAGAFHTCAYFIGGDRSTCITAASLYRSILRGGQTGELSAPIHVWSAENQVALAQDYLRRCAHPVVSFGNAQLFPLVTPALPVSLHELPSYAALPRKALPGLMVATHAAFARDIVIDGGRWQSHDRDGVDIGHIYHMGSAERARVALSADALTGHLFVTGTTGVGKSNFCYGIVDALVDQGVHVIVIEPAKGEYSRVFGGRPDFLTFGVNENTAPLLKINPFAFPKGIHVLEHIGYLVDIFNASWPMYASMPSILKDAIQTCYEKCGFSMIRGTRAPGGRFPTFQDLLEELPRVIDSNDYSSEVKGNYKGALLTRVRSMTNGLFGSIFDGDELGDEVLFDRNVLVDISRAGSSETKALLMGMLVIRLSEYRKCSGLMNSPLRHVTILEEAHHLLRAENTASAEGVNLRGASVEILTNAIAEMRTYGEGFFIADQSPVVMHPSVISNTNTKIVFKLPSLEDRLKVGRSIVLNEEQVQELARLETGVAAVYQSNWAGAVLCKTDYFPPQRSQPLCYAAPEECYDEREAEGQCLAALLMGSVGQQSSLNRELCQRVYADRGQYRPQLRALIEDVLREYLQLGAVERPFGALCLLVDGVVDAEAMMRDCGDATDIARWADAACEYVLRRATLTPQEAQEVVSVCLNLLIPRKSDARKLFYRYLGYKKTESAVSGA